MAAEPGTHRVLNQYRGVLDALHAAYAEPVFVIAAAQSEAAPADDGGPKAPGSADASRPGTSQRGRSGSDFQPSAGRKPAGHAGAPKSSKERPEDGLGPTSAESARASSK